MTYEDKLRFVHDVVEIMLCMSEAEMNKHIKSKPKQESNVVEQMKEYVVEVSSVDDFGGYYRSKERVTRCRECNWLGRETVVPGKYRCDRTEHVTTLDDYCSKAVRRDAE